jgi:hypothetical protein
MKKFALTAVVAALAFPVAASAGTVSKHGNEIQREADLWQIRRRTT